MVALRSCVSFSCMDSTVKQPSINMLTYPFPCVFPSQSGRSGALNRVSCAIQYVLISGTYFIHLSFSHSVASDSLWPPWTAARQASLPFTVSWSLFKLMSVESVMPSNHLILCRPPALSLSQHQGLFQWVGSSHQVAKVLELQHPSSQWSTQYLKKKSLFLSFLGWDYSPSGEPYERGGFGSNSPSCTDPAPVFCLMTSVKTEGSRAVFPGGPDSALGYVWGSSWLWRWLGNAEGAPCSGPGRLVPCVPAVRTLSSQTSSPPGPRRVPLPLGNTELGYAVWRQMVNYLALPWLWDWPAASASFVFILDSGIS